MPFYKSKWFFICLLVFVVANSGLNYFLVCSTKETVQNSKLMNEQLSETYVDLSSLNIHEISERLKREVELLNKRKAALFENVYTEDNIAIFASNIEKTAEKVKITTNTPVINYQRSDVTTYELVSFDFMFKGTLKEIFALLEALNRYHRGLLVENFSVRSSKQSDGQLIGGIKLLTLVAADSLATEDEEK